jgi:hypothetical protein
MRSRFAVAALSVGACLAVTGCGGASAPPVATVSLTAPTSGASVIVDTIHVIGTVHPRSASVTIAGRKEQPSSGGRFNQVLRLHPGLNQIALVAQARGYAEQKTEIAVTYSPPSSGAGAPARDVPSAGGAAGSASTFVSRANAVCAAANSFITAEPRPTTRALAIHDAAVSIRYLLKTELPQLEAIVPPPSLAAGYASAINDSKQAINLIVDQTIPSLAVSLRVFMQDIESLDAQANRTATALGLPACAVDPVARGLDTTAAGGSST